MKHFLLSLCVVLAFASMAQAQNINRIEYFFDTPVAFGSGTAVSFTATTNISNLAIAANISSLSVGMHQLFVRSRDVNGKWSLTNRAFFYKMPNPVTVSNLSRLEYFFDTDPGYGLGTTISFTAGNSTLNNIAVSSTITSLPIGIHQLFVRSRDVAGNWSITNRAFFYKMPSALAISNITNIEYFFDTDPGFGLATQVAFTAGTTIANMNIAENVSTLSVGIHQLFIRSRDANGNWSVSNRAFFYRMPNATTLSTIANIEYFIDTDPGLGLATQVAFTAGTDIANVSIAENVAALSVGIHQLFIRSQDANGNWGVSNRAFFYRMPNTNAIPDIVKLEYYVDFDPGFGQATNVPITVGTDIANINLNQNVSALTTGTHNLFVRSQDANGKWSITNKYEIIKDIVGVKLFLEGYYTNNSQMQTVLFNEGIETSVTNNVDSIEVSLRNINSPYASVYSQIIMLHNNGEAPFNFPNAFYGSNYYIVINHRNTIETWSANPIQINENTSYNFTTSASKAYGNNQIEVEPNVFAFYSGDINQDEVIDGSDVVDIENGTESSAFGYISADLNGDGSVDGSDYPVWDANSGLSIYSIHP